LCSIGTQAWDLCVGRFLATGKNYVSYFVCNDVIKFINDFYLKIYIFFYRTECYDYLLDIAVQMKQYGLDPSVTPNDYELKYQANSLKCPEVHS